MLLGNFLPLRYRKKVVTVGIVGVGAIAGAFISGLTTSPSASKYSVSVIGKDHQHGEMLSKKWQLPATSLTTACKDLDVIIIAVKPHSLDQVLDGIVAALNTDPQPLSFPIVISFVNGTSCDYITQRLAAVGPVPVAQVMPNTSMSIRQGILGVSLGTHVSARDRSIIDSLLATTGEVFYIPTTAQSSFSALAGSGPAYIYFIAESMIDASVAIGLPRELAERLTALTIAGAGSVLCDNNQQSPTQLRAKVTSPGGSTACGIAELEKHSVRSAFYTALAAAQSKVESISR